MPPNDKKKVYYSSQSLVQFFSYFDLGNTLRDKRHWRNFSSHPSKISSCLEDSNVQELGPWQGNLQYPHIRGQSKEQNLLVRKSVNNWHFGRMVLSTTNRGKWSATTFSTLFLYLIVISNSWTRRIHHMKRGFASYLVIKYFKAAWSVKTTMIDPMR